VQNTDGGLNENVRQTGSARPGIAGTSILFSVTIFLFIFLGYRVQSREFYSGIIISEFILISLPAVIFLAVKKLRPRETLRLNRARFLTFFVVFWIMIFAIPLAAVFNMINLFIVDTAFGKVMVESMPVGENGLGLLLSILVIAGSAGICEEFVFRGVIQRGFESFGPIRSILLSALLFSLTHLDFQKILGTFLLGVLIGFIVYRTNSLFCGMFAHFTNNAAAVITGYVSNKLLGIFQKAGDIVQPTGSDISEIFDIFSSMPRQQLFAVLLVYGFMLMFCAIILILFIYLLIRLNPKRSTAEGQVPVAGAEDEKAQMTAASKAKGLLWLMPGFFFIGLWFYTQACNFLSIGNGVTEAFRHMIGAG
jgi:membrane protease YdiL (CAAX protease family)